MPATDEQQHMMILMMNTTLSPRRPWLTGSSAIESRRVPPLGEGLGGAGGGGSEAGAGASAGWLSASGAVVAELPGELRDVWHVRVGPKARAHRSCLPHHAAAEEQVGKECHCAWVPMHLVQ